MESGWEAPNTPATCKHGGGFVSFFKPPMRLAMVPSIRFRREVSNGGPHLSVAYDLSCFMTYFELYKLCLQRV